MELTPNVTDYDSTYSEFEWEVPDEYNFVLDDFERWAEDRGKVALYTVADDGKTALKQTFWELKVLSNKFANILKEKGIKKGDRVFLMLPRSSEWYVAALGMMKAGVVMMPTPTLATGHDIDYRINRAEAVMAITNSEGAEKVDAVSEKIPGLKHRLIVGGEKEGWESWEDKMEKAERTFDVNDFGGKTRSDDPLLVYFTSGTTGNPKMVRHLQKYAIGHTVTAMYAQDLTNNDLIWVIADTGWAKTAWGKLFGQWRVGASVMQWSMTSRFNPETVARIIETYGVSVFCAPPTAYRMMITHLDLKTFDWTYLRHSMSAGEPLNPEVIKVWSEATGLQIYDYYGQTETVALCANLQAFPIKAGSMGKPTPGHHIEIVDDDGTILPTGEEGHIAVQVKPNHPPGIFHGYWKDDELSEEVFRGEWYYTGDKAYKDEDGYLWFVGRADDVIKASGYRIGPFEVESALQEHEAVQESAVIGVPDEMRGQAVKAFIILAPGFEGTDELKKEIQDHVKKVTAPYKYPRIIDFVTELPKTISGKIRRVELRKMEKDRQ